MSHSPHTAGAMKPFEELTRLGRLRRMRRLAYAALAAYGVDDARITFVRQAGNTLFRVYTSDLPVPESVLAPDDRMLLPVSVSGVPDSRNCSLLRWTKDRSVSHRFRLHHLRAQGRLMARLSVLEGLCSHSFAGGPAEQ